MAGFDGTVPSTLLGLDFSCAPSSRKPLTLAWGRRSGAVVKLDKLDEVATLAGLEQALASAHSMLAACDFPFGLPRPFVQALCDHPPNDFPADHLAALRQTIQQAPGPKATAAETLIQALHAHCRDRAGFQRLVDGWGQTWDRQRGDGPKLLHRPTDTAVPGISSTSPLQTRYVPVGKMYFEGLIRLVQADFSLPGLRQGRPDALAFEAYPGFLSGEVLGRRSYKSDQAAPASQQQARLIARMDLVDALEQGRTRLGLRLKLTPGQRDFLVSDAKGDRLDAALCLVQAAWAQREGEENPTQSWGLPKVVDPIEGWILTA
ncbi:DUF429 domain-containing protein [Aquabacterium sp.]|uniref:DUF429 domain-containing protein n=1 Tax=Aquabacterium sp. TaxID=1872578 RepID=UPI0019A73F12|nr:DUF429 domain-containing protein [Aquabacterium sp.]MBC7702254.1 DUF429 domain-containing protein [Aquabacterium sp.]